MQRGEAWEPVAGRLAASYRSACLDFETWTFDERIGELLEAAPAGGALVGYSMGGRLALHAALRDPKRFTALVLVGVTAGIEDPCEREERRRSDGSLAEWMERRSIEQVVERWEQQPVFATQSPELRDSQRAGRLSHDPEKLAGLLRSAGQGASPPVWGRLPVSATQSPELRDPRRAGRRSHAPERLGGLRRGAGRGASPPVWGRLGTLSCGVLLPAGEQDRRYATAARRMAEAIPDARVK